MTVDELITVTCQYSVACRADAEGVITHPVLDYVPCCGHHAAFAGQPLIPAEFVR